MGQVSCVPERYRGRFSTGQRVVINPPIKVLVRQE